MTELAPGRDRVVAVTGAGTGIGRAVATKFGAPRALESGRMEPANEMWFRRGLLRHIGLMSPEVVADAIVAAVTLPADYQFEITAIIPTAPTGDLPTSFEAWRTAIMQSFTAAEPAG